MSNQFNAKVAHMVELASAELIAANEKLTAYEQADQAYAAKVATVVDELISTGYIKQAARETAIQKLSNPSFALDQVVKLATGPSQQAAEVALGTQVPSGNSVPVEKKAAARGGHWDRFADRMVGANG